MAFNHVALATRDLDATHAFYTQVMGFTLQKVVAAPTDGGGWAKHLFYNTGDDELLAFWDLHDDAIGDDFPTAISTGVGLPAWVNHLAFNAPTLNDLEARKQVWREHGITVAEIDHGWCTSIYATDPNGILVEFCCLTQAFTDADQAEAERLLADPHPALESPPAVTIFKPVTVSA
ncbi:MAG: VOC family protein [Actinobacteria bacterium]|nr:VOC family protein [Actinomycetota bacterium]